MRRSGLDSQLPKYYLHRVLLRVHLQAGLHMCEGDAATQCQAVRCKLHLNSTRMCDWNLGETNRVCMHGGVGQVLGCLLPTAALE